MSKILTLRIDDELYTAVSQLQKRQRRKYINEMGALLLMDGLARSGILCFNRACAALGVTDRREQFSHWRQLNDVPGYATMAEWENYLEQFYTANDSADLDATQQDALGVLA